MAILTHRGRPATTTNSSVVRTLAASPDHATPIAEQRSSGSVQPILKSPARQCVLPLAGRSPPRRRQPKNALHYRTQRRQVPPGVDRAAASRGRAIRALGVGSREAGGVAPGHKLEYGLSVDPAERVGGQISDRTNPGLPCGAPDDRREILGRTGIPPRGHGSPDHSHPRSRPGHCGEPGWWYSQALPQFPKPIVTARTRAHREKSLRDRRHGHRRRDAGATRRVAVGHDVDGAGKKSLHWS